MNWSSCFLHSWTHIRITCGGFFNIVSRPHSWRRSLIRVRTQVFLKIPGQLWCFFLVESLVLGWLGHFRFFGPLFEGWRAFLADLLAAVKNLASGFLGVCLGSFCPKGEFRSFSDSSLILGFFPGPFPGVLGSATFGVSKSKAFLFFPLPLLLFCGDFFPVSWFCT